MTIGETILKLRHEERLTQQSLSIMAAISERYINYVEQDVKKPSLKVLVRIAKAAHRKMEVSYSPVGEMVSLKFTVCETLVRSRSFESLVSSSEIQNRLYYDCLKLCNYNQEKAKDLRQETTFQALIFEYRYNANTQLYTWLFAIAKNISKATGKKDQNLVFVEQYMEGLLDEAEVDVFKENTGLYSYIQKLSPKRRQIYKLRLINMPYTDIANQLGLRPDYVKSRFWEIKSNLSKLMKPITCNT